ncbi:MAG: hypothetical protein WD063_04905 [Pirellulales bacterium]
MSADSIRGHVGTLLLSILVASVCAVAYGEDKPAELPTALATSYLPPDASFAILIRPAELAVPEVMQPVVEAFDELLKPAKLGISVADIDEFKLVLVGVVDMMERQGPRLVATRIVNTYLVIRARQAVDWKTVFGVTGQARQEEIDGRKLYHMRGDGAALWLPDERTVVCGALGEVRRTMENPDPNDRESWTDHWEQAARSPLAAFVRMSELEEVAAFVSGLEPIERQEEALATLVADAEYGVLQGNVTTKGLEISATVLTRSNEGSVRVAPAVSLLLTEFATTIGSELPAQQADAAKLREQLAGLLGSTQIVTEGKTVTVKALVTPKMIEVFSATARLLARPRQ